MTTTTTIRLALTAGLAAGVMLLTGCDPATTGAGASGLGCDPHGVTLLQSGCGGGTSSGRGGSAGSAPAGCDPHGMALFGGCPAGSVSGPSGGRAQPFTPDPGVSASWIRLAARHEAGHKAVADYYGWTVTDCHLNKDGSGWTYALVGWSATDAQRLAYEVAGSVAVHSVTGADDDFKAADQILSHYPVAEWSRMEKAAEATAAQIISQRSTQVDHDAAVLTKQGSL